jgi:uncharacterized repeat protein (TIGR01451 family)
VNRTGPSTHAALWLVLLASGGRAEAQYAWFGTGPMSTFRILHSATLLPDGTVLAAGGPEGPSAEIYDPLTGVWTTTGSLNTARFSHTATLLPNGKVLVAGGAGYLSSAELYEPATGMWTPTGSMATGRANHTATLLPNGKVLVAGGITTGGGGVSSAEIYDPTMGSWKTTGALHATRSSHTATLLPNGKVLVAGGSSLTFAELYDPAAGTWATTGSMATARFSATASFLSNGKVLVAGGNSDGATSLASTELFDPGSGIWSSGGSLATPRYSHTAALLPDGKVLVAGGFLGVYSLASAEVYDPVGGTWAVTVSMPQRREGHSATTLTDGHVLVAGDTTDGSTLLFETLPVADLSITKTDGQVTASPGQTVNYTITGSNLGPTAVNGATVSDTVPASLTGAQWTCVSAGGATCTAGPTSGSINDTVNLPLGGTVTYTLSGQVAANASSLTNTATIAPPPTIFDPDMSDNSATDADTLICSGDLVVLADGRRNPGTIGAGATQWFAAGLKKGDSYSLEVLGVTPGTLTVFSGDDGCSGSSTVVATDTSAVDPVVAGSALRLSFTASGTSGFFHAKLVNGSAGALPFELVWSDTALYSAAWTTNGTYDTYYSIENSTGATLTGVLMLFDGGVGVAGTSYVTIPGGQKVSTNTAALGIMRNHTGTARFTHNGPPRAVVVEAAIANFALTPPYVQPVKFEAVRETR